MPKINLTYAPKPDKLVKFIKLQVTDAILNEEIFESDPPPKTAASLFAMALIATIPPIPNNQQLLGDTLLYIKDNSSFIERSQYPYPRIETTYKRYISVFEKSAQLTARTPMSNPYEEVAKAALFDLGLENDGVKLFNLTLWMTHYCKDAIAMFYTKDLKQNTSTSNLYGDSLQVMPPTADAYGLISLHVNSVLASPSFFTDSTPSNATEVLTALFFFFGLYLPSKSNAFIQDTLEYTKELLIANNFPEEFFDKILESMEAITKSYLQNMPAGASAPTFYTVDKVVDCALQLMNAYPNYLIKTNIMSYLPTFISDTLSQLFSDQQ